MESCALVTEPNLPIAQQPSGHFGKNFIIFCGHYENGALLGEPPTQVREKYYFWDVVAILFTWLGQTRSGQLVYHVGTGSSTRLTFPIGHGIEKAPRRVRSCSAFDESDVVTCLDAKNGKQLHIHARHLDVLTEHIKFGRDEQLRELMLGALVSSMRLVEALRAERRAVESFAELSEALLALKLGDLPTDAALTRRVLEDVRDVEIKTRNYARVHLELSSEARHLND